MESACKHADCGKRTFISRSATLDWRGLFLAMLLAVASCGPAAAGEHQSNKLPVPQGAVVLEVHGDITNTNVDGAAKFDMAMLRALPAAHLDTSTSVTDGVHRFDGFLMRDLLDRIGARGSTITASALNDYAVDIDMEEFYHFDVIAAYEMDGRTLLPSDKGPLWIVYPRDQHDELQDIRYDYRWVWQMNRIDVR